MPTGLPLEDSTAGALGEGSPTTTLATSFSVPSQDSSTVTRVLHQDYTPSLWTESHFEYNIADEQSIKLNFTWP